MKVFFVLFLNFGFILSQNLFFSEYIEGSSYNKALEIFNPAKNEIELTGYQLWKVTNSDGSWTDENGNGSYALDLSGYLIPPNDVLVICRTSFDIDKIKAPSLTDLIFSLGLIGLLHLIPSPPFPDTLLK